MIYKKVKLIDEQFSAVGFGCWGLSGPSVWNNSNDTDSIRAVEQAFDLGVNFFDVAPVYGFGHAEQILGKALKGKRDKVLIASKCGLVWDQKYNIKNCLKKESIYKEIDLSLKRLNTDYIDIYQIHWPDPNTPIEETIDALNNIKKSGKIRYIGVCNFPVELTKNAMKLTKIVSQQCYYNMIDRNAKSYHEIPLNYQTEKEILPFCNKYGQAFFPYSPLFQGMLTGTFKDTNNFDENDVRANNPCFKGEKFRIYMQIVKKLKKIAFDIGRPLSQISINWLIKKQEITSVICGALNSEQVKENVGSIEWELSDDVVEQIDDIIKSYIWKLI